MRTRGRIERLLAWHLLYDMELLDSGDYVRAVEIADRGGRDEAPPPRDERAELRAEIGRMQDVIRARDTELKRLRGVIDASRVVLEQGGVRIALPMGRPEATWGDRYRRDMMPPIATYTDVLIALPELQQIAVAKIQQRVDTELMRAHAVPPLLLAADQLRREAARYGPAA